MPAAIVVPARHSQEYSTLMRLGDSEFRPRWLSTLVFGLAVATFVVLGLWQIGRAAEKARQAADLATQGELPALPLGQALVAAEPLRYRHLSATGVFEAGGQILLEARRYAGKTGFHVVTPLRIAGGETRVLVNRGWIPGDAQGGPTPAPVPEGAVTVTGPAHIPAPPALVLAGADAVTAWGGRWPFLTVDLYRTRVAYPVQPVVMLLDPSAEGGFVRDWPKEMPKEGMHLGYAVQWFAFALIALAIWVRLSLEGRREGPRPESGEPT
jgi:surfeit locus 1 family protein